jgi:N utilization substance protein A
MKSEFSLAFNQICAEYNLPREVVLDAVRAALITAYRRDWKVPSNQNITANISLETGLARIYIEKTIVDEVEDKMVEITLKKARRIKPQVEMGDVVMVDVTPRDFGRIAAQTAKQVITQRLREAERESQYNRFSRQENEIIIGTVQSITPHGVTLHLERTEEAHMPRREQIPGERYTLHQKIRVYVLEVKRTPRGPDIIVSRSHPLMLRRLLELEVPEVRNGQVEIKAIAREAGTRAKVAVTTEQSGLDPVGACVGMRGIRIQTISRELHGERIDVVKWDSDPRKFIANSLSMKKVISVTLDQNEQSGRTASVVVLDDQLSLAIGRSGQNARLAAKLTGWRVDIRGVTEAALWALDQVNTNPDLLDNLKDTAALISRLASIMRSHEKDRYPYNDEELKVIKTVVEGIHKVLVARRKLERPGVRRQERARRSAREKARIEREEAQRKAQASVPEAAYERDLETLGLPEKTYRHLVGSDLQNVGQVMERVALGDEALLMLDGVGAKALRDIKDAVANYDLAFIEPEAETAEAEVVVEETAETAEAVEEMVEALEVTELEDVPVPSEAVEEPEPIVAPDVEAEAVVEVAADIAVEAEAEIEAPTEVEEAPVEVEAPTEGAAEAEAAEAAAPAVETVVEEAAEDEVSEAAEAEEALEDIEEEEDFDADIFAQAVEMYTEIYEDQEELTEEPELPEPKKKKRQRRKPRTVVYDEESGETFVIRKRRHGAERWEEYGEDF